MKIAVIHDWLVTYAGAERVLEQILQLYPEAELYSLIDFLPVNGRDFILNKEVHTSFIQKLPFAAKKYRNYLPLMPLAIEQFDLSEFDLIISSSHAVAKGVLTNSNQLHICYCYTPIRYAWDLQHQYLKETKLDRGLKGIIARGILQYIRLWDQSTVNRVDYFIAISQHIAKRIKKIYGRDSTVIYPPVDINKFYVGNKRENFFLTASRMVPYKRIDLIVEAFSENGLPLVVIGDGPEYGKIKEKAKKNVEILGYKEDSVLREYLQKTRAFVFAAEEDFGILPVEAQACGTPVLAFGKGGVTETIVSTTNRENTPTGILFHEQTIEALNDAVKQFQLLETKFDPYKIREHAEQFSKERFRKEFKEFVEQIIKHNYSARGIYHEETEKN
ncbi:MAG: glycosyl transferase [Flavobacterium sp.]|nr:glycosyl transferase [Flavobacterium sp.]